MAKAALIVYAGTETSADAGRIVNAMVMAREFVEAGDDVRVILDGAGTQWLPILESEDYEYHALYELVREQVAVCDYCASAHGVDNAVDSSDVERLGGNDGHPSVHSLVDDDYEIITF